MANVDRLKRFSYQSIVIRFAKAFGLDPDYVFDNHSMNTVINILEELKEEREFDERYQHFYERMSAITPKK